MLADDQGDRCRQVFSPDYLQPAILLYRRQGTVSGDLLAMVSAVGKAQSLLCDGLGPAPRLDANVLPPAAWLHEAVGQIAFAVGTHSPAGGESLREFAAKCRMIDVALLAEAARGDQALAHVTGTTGAPADVAVFILRMVLQPFYAWRYNAGPASSTDQAFPARGSCPACGGRPLMGKHSEPDGQRFLRCSACGHEWAFPRIGCPGCGETDPKQIESLFVHGDEGHRLYLCMQCKRYLKVTDERLLGVRAYLPLEDIVTLHLDEIGRQRGFAPLDDEVNRPGPGRQDT